ncbi:MAG: uroporphyrinogen decarboxylase family protein [Verrucomicrobiae bacterium]|nr:uroporphyrinogen decarboxylase family protein [Verrucomicrobiae bacterium]
MTKREVVQRALRWEQPPYVPWHCAFTHEAAEKLRSRFKKADVDEIMGNHLLYLGCDDRFIPMENDCVRDVFGVVWDRHEEKDIGTVKGLALPEPTLSGYSWPDPLDSRFFRNIPKLIKERGDCYRVFAIGFSLFERAWSLRGMENFLMDFHENPDFARDLLNSIADFNVAQIREAVKYDIDAIHFGDDWGQQHGLIMGPKIWREFIRPVLKRMYGAAREAGKLVTIHSCGDVSGLFDDLIELGVNCFNPFQPEVMDVDRMTEKYRGRLSFDGGLSTQRTLPYGTPEDVGREVRHLLEIGRKGGYIFAPAHAVEGDVPLENMLAFIETIQSQPGVRQ